MKNMRYTKIKFKGGGRINNIRIPDISSNTGSSDVIVSRNPKEVEGALKYDGNFYGYNGDKWVLLDAESNIISTEYTELVELKNNKELIAGKYYRITDYETVIPSKEFGSDISDYSFYALSKGIPFDIIVLALNENTLSEDAFAIQHEGNSYFENNNLSAWKLKYCLDNDTSRFDFAEPNGGKGVIYRMIDEFGNDCPYDFKNIQFQYPEDERYVFTFNYLSNDVESDASLNILESICCVNNIIKPLTNKIKLLLNDIVFVSADLNSFVAKNNVIKNDCYNISFGTQCNDNIIENGCYDNIFERGSKNNILGRYCHNNSFGSTSYGNILGDGCYNNTFIGGFNNILGKECFNNSFTTNTHGNILAYRCQNNTFNNSYSNVLGLQCKNNTFEYGGCNLFGNNCDYNTIKPSALYNTFGNNCDHNEILNSSQHNKLGDGCSFINLESKCSYNSFAQGCSYISFIKQYTENIIVENNTHIQVTSSQSTSSTNKLINFTIAQGVNITTTTKQISHDTLNDAFRTIYQAAGSTAVDI